MGPSGAVSCSAARAESSSGNVDKYRATGVTITARIYHVELTAEVVPLCEKV